MWARSLAVDNVTLEFRKIGEINSLPMDLDFVAACIGTANNGLSYEDIKKRLEDVHKLSKESITDVWYLYPVDQIVYMGLASIDVASWKNDVVFVPLLMDMMPKSLRMHRRTFLKMAVVAITTFFTYQIAAELYKAIDKERLADLNKQMEDVKKGVVSVSNAVVAKKILTSIAAYYSIIRSPLLIREDSSTGRNRLYQSPVLRGLVLVENESQFAELKVYLENKDKIDAAIAEHGKLLERLGGILKASKAWFKESLAESNKLFQNTFKQIEKTNLLGLVLVVPFRSAHWKENKSPGAWLYKVKYGENWGWLYKNERSFWQEQLKKGLLEIWLG